jgi:CRP-like cAMP-binding protein
VIAGDVGELLAAHPFFAGLEAAQLAALATLGRTRDLPGGRVVFREGEPATTFDAIVSGRVAVQVHAPQRPPMTVQTIGAGSVLGWSWLFPPFLRRFDVDAATPQLSHLAGIDGGSHRHDPEPDRGRAKVPGAHGRAQRLAQHDSFSKLIAEMANFLSHLLDS